MRGCAVRILTGVGLLAYPHACVGQTDLPAPAVYGSFLSQAAQFAGAGDSDPVRVNGGPGGLARPTPKQRLGLTDQESEVLDKLAREYAAESALLRDAVKRMTFERRLYVISSQQVPARLSQGLRDLDERRAQVVADHVQRLGEAFGAERFRMLNDYIRSREKDKEFFPALHDPSRPVVKKVARAAEK